MNTQPLTGAKALVLAAIAQAPRPVNAREIRANAGLPATTSALDNVQAVLADLVALGYVTRTTQPNQLTTYTVATQAPEPTEADRLTAQRRDLARTIANQAEAIAAGTVTHEYAAVRRLLDNVNTLAAWTPQP